MNFILYLVLLSSVIFLVVLICVRFLRYWFLGRDEEPWCITTGDLISSDLIGRDHSFDPYSCEKEDPSSSVQTTGSNRRRSSLFSRLSRTSKSSQIKEEAEEEDVEPQSEDSTSAISSPQPTATLILLNNKDHESTSTTNTTTMEDRLFFHFPVGVKSGLSSNESNVLPTTRQSFRYNVRIPDPHSQTSKKRRSLPELLLNISPFSYGRRRSSERRKQQQHHHHQSNNKEREIVINIQDFDDYVNKRRSPISEGVGLKGSLDLPVCDESPTADQVEVKPIMSSTSNNNSNFSRIHFAPNTKEIQETLI